MKRLTVALFEPQIPQNSGNIARTCAVTGTKLILLGRLGFSLSEKYLRRAGLDYWNNLETSHILDVERWFDENFNEIILFSSKASKNYCDISYKKDQILLFGSETTGVPLSWREKLQKQSVTFPMLENQRCLNLSNSVCAGVYEALRQTSFSQIKPISQELA